MRRLPSAVARRLPPLLVAALLAACGDPTGPAPALQRALARWERAAPADYELTVRVSCDCLAERVGPAAVRVRDGVVESRRYAADDAPVPAPFAEGFPDAPGLFALVADAVARRAASLQVDYDPTHGHPVRIAIDYDRQMVDDEIVYTASPLRLP